MVRIRRIGVLKAAAIAAAITFVASVIFMVPVWMLLVAAGTSVEDADTGALVGVGLVGGLVLGFIIAVFYAILAFIGTAIAVALYNLVAGAIGGVELQLEALTPTPPTPTPTQWSTWSATGSPGGPPGSPPPG